MLIIPFIDNNFDHGDKHTQMLEKFLTKNKSKFESQLIGNLSHINYRAKNINEITIESIEYQQDNLYCMNYTYDWEVYNGCVDMNMQDEEEGFVCFTVEKNGEIKFEIPKFEERSTYNEF